MSIYKCYQVKIKTANRLFAGTDDDIYINLIGDNYGEHTEEYVY